MQAETAARTEAREIAGQLCEAIANRDLEGATALFASDPETSFFGSAGSQPYRGPAEVRSILSKLMSLPETFHMRLIDPVISVSGKTAWLAAGVDMVCQAGGITIRRHPYRLTLVLEQRQGQWLIAHYHGSEPPVSQER